MRQFEESDYDDWYEFLSQRKEDEFEAYPGITYENGKELGGWGLEVYYECFGKNVYRPAGDNVPLKRDFDDSATIWDLMHRLDELHDYIKCVEALHACLKE